jgi:hypothetical protein
VLGWVTFLTAFPTRWCIFTIHEAVAVFLAVGTGAVWTCCSCHFCPTTIPTCHPIIVKNRHIGRVEFKK